MERVRCYAFLWVLSWTRNIARFHSILSVSLNSVFERRDIFSLYFFLFFLFFPCVRAFTRLSTPFPLPSPRFSRSIYFLSRFNRWPANDVPGLVAPPPPFFLLLSRGYFFCFSFFFSFSYFLFSLPSPLTRFTPLTRRTRETNYQFSEYNKCPILPLPLPLSFSLCSSLSRTIKRVNW